MALLVAEIVDVAQKELDRAMKWVMVRSRGCVAVIAVGFNSGEAEGFLSDCDCYGLFGDPYKTEYPKIYRTARGLLKKIEELKVKRFYTSDWRPCLWVSDDLKLAGNELEIYEKMIGVRFPGVPRQ